MSTQEEIILAFKKKFGVSIVTDKDKLELDIGYNRAEESRVNDYVQSILCAELSIYSNQVLKKSKLSRIVLCKNLASWGESHAGLADLQWLGFTWFMGNQICIDVEYPLNHYARHVVHHELYHLIDSADDFSGLRDNEWKKLNPPNFKYKDDLGVNQKTTLTKGFISNYAMKAVHEDKAETYARMIVDYNGIEKLAKNDLVLKRKIYRMKELMKAFSCEFDDLFWQARAKSSTAAPHS